MKKLFTLAFAAFAAFAMNAATIELPLAGAGETGWGGVTYDATTHTMTFPVAWDGGMGWWIAADYSQYDRIVVEFASAIPMQIALSVEYYKDGNTDSSNGYEQFFAAAGSKSIEATLDASKKSAVQKIYFQAAAAGSIVLKSAKATSEAAVDPLDGLTGEDVGSIEGNAAGNYCYLPLALIQQYAYFEILLENTTNAKETGWGIGKIVAVSDWSNPAYEFGCNNPGLGKVNRYVIAQEDMLEYAKKNGVYHTDDYGQQGVHIGSYEPDSKLTSVKGYGDAGSTGDCTRTDIGAPGTGESFLHVELATLQAYDQFEIVINVTNAEVGANWGVGKIVPIDLWSGSFFEFKTVKAGVGEQKILVDQADMLSYAKVDGAFYTDGYGRQGVTISVYDDKAALVKVVGISCGSGTQNINTTVAPDKARKVIENGQLFIIRGNQKFDITGKVVE